MAKIKFIFSINVYLKRGIVENECDKGEKVIFPCGHTTLSALNSQEIQNTFSIDTQHYLR